MIVVPSPIKAVLFDLDGTLVDSRIADTSALKALLHEKAGIEVSLALLQTYFGIPTKTILAKFVPESRVEDLYGFWLEMRTRHIGLAEMFAGVRSTLKALRMAHIPTALVTSQFEEESALIRAHYGLHAYFDVWITSDMTARHKPDPAPVLAALERLGVAPQNALMVGDTIFDMDAGKAAGARTAAALWGARDRDGLLARHPDFALENPSELLQTLGLPIPA